MRDTAFYVPPAKAGRLAAPYIKEKAGKLAPSAVGHDDWFTPPPFEAGGIGLVSTADDLRVFGRMLLA